MCAIQIANRINQNFMLTNLILSMNDVFTCKDVIEKLKSCSLNISEKVVKNAIERLRDNDYLEEIGCSYKVIPQEESTRWG